MTLVWDGAGRNDVAAALAAATPEEMSGGAEFAGDPNAPAFSAAFPTSELEELGCLPAPAQPNGGQGTGSTSVGASQ